MDKKFVSIVVETYIGLLTYNYLRNIIYEIIRNGNWNEDIDSLSSVDDSIMKKECKHYIFNSNISQSEFSSIFCNILLKLINILKNNGSWRDVQLKYINLYNLYADLFDISSNELSLEFFSINEDYQLRKENLGSVLNMPYELIDHLNTELNNF